MKVIEIAKAPTKKPPRQQFGLRARGKMKVFKGEEAQSRPQSDTKTSKRAKEANPKQTQGNPKLGFRAQGVKVRSLFSSDAN